MQEVFPGYYLDLDLISYTFKPLGLKVTDGTPYILINQDGEFVWLSIEEVGEVDAQAIIDRIQ